MERSVLITILLYISSLNHLTGEAPVKEYWVFKDKYTLKALQMDSDHKFSWYSRSCTGSTKFKGLYKDAGDTIFLLDPSKPICLLRKEHKLYTYFTKEKECSEFQPLTKVSGKKYRHLIAKHNARSEKEEKETDRVNKTASGLAPFLDFFMRGLGRKK